MNPDESKPEDAKFSDTERKLLSRMLDQAMLSSMCRASVGGESHCTFHNISFPDKRTDLLQALAKELDITVDPIDRLTSTSQLGPWDTENITFGDNIHASGHSQLTIYSDGAYNFNGRFHNPDLFGYEVSLGWVVVDNSGTAFTFGTNGKMGGAVTGGSKNYEWSNAGTNPAIAAAWQGLEAGWHYSWKAHINTDMGGLIQSIIDALKAAGTIITTVIEIVG
jgi:hypothetical protein